MKRLPDFFILGAPKCGTTSLAGWLGEHPQIFVSPLKEPHFFNDDMRFRNIDRWEAYLRLFHDVQPHHRAVGEASVFYLYSETAVPNIEARIGSRVRYIVMIRNPVDMVYSLHEQFLFSGDENVEDFREAWALSPKRRIGQKIPPLCREPRLLDYQWMGLLGYHLERLFQKVPRERVLVLLLDDLRDRPREVYLRVLRFLGVPDNGRENFPALNRAKERRWPLLERGLLPIRRTVYRVKMKLGLEHMGTGILRWLDAINRKERPRLPLPDDLRQEMMAYYREDVERLSALTGVDLFSRWGYRLS
jgi:hypothetical protein